MMKKIYIFLMTLIVVFGFSVQAYAVSTFAELNFRRFNEEPFTDPGYYVNEYGTNLTSLSYTSPRGSIGWFTADAAAGTLRGFADAVNGVIGVVGGDNVYARGFVNDDFTLNGPTPGTPVSITAYFTLDGTLSGASSLPYTLEAFENAYVATQFTALTGNDLFDLWARTEDEMDGCWLAGCSGFSIDVHRVASLTLDIIAGDPFGIYYYLYAIGGWAYGGSGGTSDFGSTGAISFDLPPGTSISSSGGFYQGPSGGEPIPEPSTLGLLGAGLVGLGIWGRKRMVK